MDGIWPGSTSELKSRGTNPGKSTSLASSDEKGRVLENSSGEGFWEII